MSLKIGILPFEMWHSELLSNIFKMLVIVMTGIHMFKNVLLIQGPRKKLMIMMVVFWNCWSWEYLVTCGLLCQYFTEIPSQELLELSSPENCYLEKKDTNCKKDEKYNETEEQEQYCKRKELLTVIAVFFKLLKVKTYLVTYTRMKLLTMMVVFLNLMMNVKT